MTQALLPNTKKSHDLKMKIADLADNILTGELSQDSVKERGKKHPPPANCKCFTTTLVNKEIWDLTFRKNRSVDLASQRVQEPLIYCIIFTYNFSRPACQRTHVKDNIALLGQVNWKHNMKRR